MMQRSWPNWHSKFQVFPNPPSPPLAHDREWETVLACTAHSVQSTLRFHRLFALLKTDIGI